MNHTLALGVKQINSSVYMNPRISNISLIPRTIQAPVYTIDRGVLGSALPDFHMYRDAHWKGHAMRASERAYRKLRADITQWRLRPGAVLGEVDLSERLGISRTPVREAISRLVADGLAEPAGGRGFAVSHISEDDVCKLYDLRDVLDTRAAALAAQHCTPETFTRLAHNFAATAEALSNETGDPNDAHPGYYELIEQLDAAIDHAADNPYLTQAQASVRLRLARVRRLSTSDPARLIAAANEHRAISEAIASGSPQLAIATTRVHLANALKNALASKELTHQADQTNQLTAAS